jgi:hypothetical protein
MSLHGADGLEIEYLTPEEVAALMPDGEPPPPAERLVKLQRKLEDVQQWGPGQIAGRRWPIGCVSLEVTQRCNLDCSLCYLSEHSEAVRDIPLAEIFRRIDMIHAHYGENADIQVSGGDPTLRARDDLVAIVARIKSKGMRASLFTNGILATRDLLQSLCAAGLTDVAFHVDMTQGRKGYSSEVALNEIRQKYIERARGLPLAIFFNTTIFADNYAEIPDIVRFFRRNSDVVSLISFQLQADTGRGVLRGRAPLISHDSVIDQIRQGAGAMLSFDTLVPGHPRCNRYAMAFEINGRLYDFYNDREFSQDLLAATAAVKFPRGDRLGAVYAAFKAFASAPRLWRSGMRWLRKTLWAAREDLWAARGRVRKLSFVIHNFMDASKLERERVHSCVFTVATGEGMLSMCVHNAKRDDYILHDQALHANKVQTDPIAVYPLKFLKGRSRVRALEEKAQARAES